MKTSELLSLVKRRKGMIPVKKLMLLVMDKLDHREFWEKVSYLNEAGEMKEVEIKKGKITRQYFITKTHFNKIK